MTRTWTFRRSSVVPAPPHVVWNRVVTPDGINDERRPWMTMSIPRGTDGVSIDTLLVGVPIGRAWLRLFGVVPFDFDHLQLSHVEPGRRFLEESSMISMRSWIHDRTVEAEGDGARVTDVVTFTPRAVLRPAGPVLARVVAAFFRHRHRRLVAHFAVS